MATYRSVILQAINNFNNVQDTLFNLGVTKYYTNNSTGEVSDTGIENVFTLSSDENAKFIKTADLGPIISKTLRLKPVGTLAIDNQTGNVDSNGYFAAVSLVNGNGSYESIKLKKGTALPPSAITATGASSTITKDSSESYTVTLTGTQTATPRITEGWINTPTSAAINLTVTAALSTEVKTTTANAAGDYTLTPTSGKLLRSTTVTVPTGSAIITSGNSLSTGTYINNLKQETATEILLNEKPTTGDYYELTADPSIAHGAISSGWMTTKDITLPTNTVIKKYLKKATMSLASSENDLAAKITSTGIRPEAIGNGGEYKITASITGGVTPKYTATAGYTPELATGVAGTKLTSDSTADIYLKAAAATVTSTIKSHTDKGNDGNVLTNEILKTSSTGLNKPYSIIVTPESSGATSIQAGYLDGASQITTGTGDSTTYFIPQATGSASTSITDHTTTAPTGSASFTPVISKTTEGNVSSSDATTTKPGSGYYISIKSASQNAKKISSTAKINSSGYIEENTALTSAENSYVGLNESAKTYIPVSAGKVNIGNTLTVTDLDGDASILSTTVPTASKRNKFSCTEDGKGLDGVTDYYTTEKGNTTVKKAELKAGTNYWYENYYGIKVTSSLSKNIAISGYISNADTEVSFTNGVSSSSIYYLPVAELKYVENSSSGNFIQVTKGGYLPSGVLTNISDIQGTLDTAEVTLTNAGVTLVGGKYILSLGKTVNAGYISQDEGSITPSIEIAKATVAAPSASITGLDLTLGNSSVTASKTNTSGYFALPITLNATGTVKGLNVTSAGYISNNENTADSPISNTDNTTIYIKNAEFIKGDNISTTTDTIVPTISEGSAVLARTTKNEVDGYTSKLDFAGSATITTSAITTNGGYVAAGTIKAGETTTVSLTPSIYIKTGSTAKPTLTASGNINQTVGYGSTAKASASSTTGYSKTVVLTGSKTITRGPITTSEGYQETNTIPKEDSEQTANNTIYIKDGAVFGGDLSHTINSTSPTAFGKPAVTVSDTTGNIVTVTVSRGAITKTEGYIDAGADSAISKSVSIKATNSADVVSGATRLDSASITKTATQFTAGKSGATKTPNSPASVSVSGAVAVTATVKDTYMMQNISDTADISNSAITSTAVPSDCTGEDVDDWVLALFNRELGSNYSLPTTSDNV